MKLHELSVKRPIAVTMAVLIMVVIGAYSLSMLPIDAMPEMDLKMAIVMTTYSNVGSEEIESLITEPIEEAVASVSGLDTMQSQSMEGMSVVMVQFTNSTDIDEAVNTIENNIDMISMMLPEDASEPTVLKLDMNSMASMMMSVSYEGYDLIQTKQFIEDNVEHKIKSAGGVASVNISGGQDRVIEVEVDHEKLHGYNMSFTDIVSAIAGQNNNLPAGSTQANKKDLSVRMMGEFRKISDIGLVPVTTSQGQVIYIRDIAAVKDSYSDRATISRINGENSISISVSSESDANTVDVVNGVMKALEEIKAQHPKFHYNITMEQASYIEDSIASVAESALIGGLLAIIILFLFLGNARNALVIGVSMPISVITTFIGMYMSEMTLNIVSLGGLALGVGMLVDNAVVVLENIFRRRKTYGDDAKTGAMRGTSEVIGAVVASVLTTCIVYVPILFLDNMMAVMFKQLAFSIVFSQIASLLATMLIVPMLSSKIDNIEERNKAFSFILTPFDRMMNFLYSVYERVLRYFLSHRKSFLAGVMAIFVLSIIVLSIKGMTLMPASDEGTVSISIELPQGTQLETTDKLVLEIEEKVKEYKEAETISTSVGSGGMMAVLGASGSNQATVTLTLSEDRKTSTADAVQIIRDILSDVTGAELSIEASSQSMSMASDEVTFRFTANDDEALEDYVLKAQKILAGIDGVTETETSVSDTKPEVRIELDKSRAARYGINTTYAASLVNYALNGTKASEFTENGSEYDIRVIYPDNYVENYEKLKTLQLKSPIGQWITLSDIADVYIEQGQTTITRVDQKRVITLTGKIYGTDLGTVNREFNRVLNEELGNVEGISQESAGAYETMMEAMTSLLTAILLGILLMYMVMAAQFENLVHPLIILCTLPLAMIGVVLGLVVAGTPLSVISCIGILMLIGIIVNNAIVLIEFINDQKRENPEMPRMQQVVNAGIVRMRPILMTSLTSILGFLPMALDSEGGGVMMQPLAVALVGGLTVGTFLTLFVIPVIYSIVDEKLEKRREKKAMKKAIKQSIYTN
jgi:HAE1 family hydrophobic/amphiphilic exporter-1